MHQTVYILIQIQVSQIFNRPLMIANIGQSYLKFRRQVNILIEQNWICSHPTKYKTHTNRQIDRQLNEIQ
jgi:hypothetical protein